MHARKVWSLQESTSMGPDDLRVAQGRKHPDRTSEGHEIPFTTGLSILSNVRSRRSVPVSIIGISASPSIGSVSLTCLRGLRML